MATDFSKVGNVVQVTVDEGNPTCFSVFGAKYSFNAAGTILNVRFASGDTYAVPFADLEVSGAAPADVDAAYTALSTVFPNANSSSGGTGTLQEVLDEGSVLDKVNTIDGGGFGFTINNTSFSNVLSVNADNSYSEVYTDAQDTDEPYAWIRAVNTIGQGVKIGVTKGDGQITFNGGEFTPANNNSIATKKYVDDNAGTPTLTETQIGFGNASNELSGSEDFTFDLTDPDFKKFHVVLSKGSEIDNLFDVFATGVQNTLNLLTGFDNYASGISNTINIADGADSADFEGYALYVNVDGSVGSSQSSGFRVTSNFGATAEVGIFTSFHIYAPNTTAGATIDTYEGISIDGFSNDAAINYLYGIYNGGQSNGAGTISHNFGIYLGDIVGGSVENYAIYTSAGLVRHGDTPEHADNAAAVLAGLAVGVVYRTGDTLKIVHA